MSTFNPHVDQPTARPTRKVAAAGIGGLAAVIGLVGLDAVGITVPGCDVANLPVQEAVTGLVAFGAAWVTRERG